MFTKCFLCILVALTGPRRMKAHGHLPKGEYGDGEEPLAAAQREFQEVTGFVAGAPFIELGSVRQKSGKVVLAWAFEGDYDPAELVSNTCEAEWPPRSKRRILSLSAKNIGLYCCAWNSNSATGSSKSCVAAPSVASSSN
jgi:predicted NUDIX family NTP pyrophosphohydrolase